MESNHNRKVVLYCSSFLVFIFIVLYFTENTLSYLVSKSNANQTGKINLIMEHKIDPKIIIFGSSVAEVGFDTRILEKKINKSIYNLAIDGTPILKSEYLINEFVEYSKNCETVIIGLAFFSLSEQKDMVEPSRFIAHKENVNLKNNIESVSPSLYSKLYSRPFYSFIATNYTYYNNAFKGLKSLFLENNFEDDSLKGFVPHIQLYDDTSSSANKQHVQISQEVVDKYIQIIKNIQKHNIDVKIVILPMYIGGQQLFDNYPEYIAEVKLLSLKSHAKLYDFSCDSITENRAFFYNNGHLNDSGAREFSNKFVNILNTK